MRCAVDTTMQPHTWGRLNNACPAHDRQPMDREQVTNSNYHDIRLLLGPKTCSVPHVHPGIVLSEGTTSVYPEHAQSLMFIIVHSAHVTPPTCGAQCPIIHRGAETVRLSPASAGPTRPAAGWHQRISTRAPLPPPLPCALPDLTYAPLPLAVAKSPSGAASRRCPSSGAPESVHLLHSYGLGGNAAGGATRPRRSTLGHRWTP